MSCGGMRNMILDTNTKTYAIQCLTAPTEELHITANWYDWYKGQGGAYTIGNSYGVSDGINLQTIVDSPDGNNCWKREVSSMSVYNPNASPVTFYICEYDSDGNIVTIIAEKTIDAYETWTMECICSCCSNGGGGGEPGHVDIAAYLCGGLLAQSISGISVCGCGVTASVGANGIFTIDISPSLTWDPSTQTLSLCNSSVNLSGIWEVSAYLCDEEISSFIKGIGLCGCGVTATVDSTGVVHYNIDPASTLQYNTTTHILSLCGYDIDLSGLYNPVRVRGCHSEEPVEYITDIFHFNCCFFDVDQLTDEYGNPYTEITIRTDNWEFSCTGEDAYRLKRCDQKLVNLECLKRIYVSGCDEGGTEHTYHNPTIKFDCCPFNISENTADLYTLISIDYTKFNFSCDDKKLYRCDNAIADFSCLASPLVTTGCRLNGSAFTNNNTTAINFDCCGFYLSITGNTTNVFFNYNSFAFDCDTGKLTFCDHEIADLSCLMDPLEVSGCNEEGSYVSNRVGRIKFECCPFNLAYSSANNMMSVDINYSAFNFDCDTGIFKWCDHEIANLSCLMWSLTCTGCDGDGNTMTIQSVTKLNFACCPFRVSSSGSTFFVDVDYTKFNFNCDDNKLYRCGHAIADFSCLAGQGHALRVSGCGNDMQASVVNNDVWSIAFECCPFSVTSTGHNIKVGIRYDQFNFDCDTGKLMWCGNVIADLSCLSGTSLSIKGCNEDGAVSYSNVNTLSFECCPFIVTQPSTGYVEIGIDYSSFSFDCDSGILSWCDKAIADLSCLRSNVKVTGCDVEGTSVSGTVSQIDFACCPFNVNISGTTANIDIDYSKFSFNCTDYILYRCDKALADFSCLAGGTFNGIYVQNTVFVMKNGNDTTGLVERFDMPCLTIEGAINKALAAGWKIINIIVYPGRYDDKIDINYGTANITELNVYLHEGVTVNGYTKVIGSGNDGEKFTITGHGTWTNMLRSDSQIKTFDFSKIDLADIHLSEAKLYKYEDYSDDYFHITESNVKIETERFTMTRENPTILYTSWTNLLVVDGINYNNADVSLGDVRIEDHKFVHQNADGTLSPSLLSFVSIFGKNNNVYFHHTNFDTITRTYQYYALSAGKAPFNMNASGDGSVNKLYIDDVAFKLKMEGKLLYMDHAKSFEVHIRDLQFNDQGGPVNASQNTIVVGTQTGAAPLIVWYGSSNISYIDNVTTTQYCIADDTNFHVQGRVYTEEFHKVTSMTAPHTGQYEFSGISHWTQIKVGSRVFTPNVVHS